MFANVRNPGDPSRSPAGLVVLLVTLSLPGCAAHTVTLAAPTADVPVMLSPSSPDPAPVADEDSREVTLRYVSGLWVVPLPGGSATSIQNVTEDPASKLDDSIEAWTEDDPDAWLQVDDIVLRNWAAYGLLYLRETSAIEVRTHLVTPTP